MLISKTVQIPTYRGVDYLGPVNGVAATLKTLLRSSLAAHKLVWATTSPVTSPKESQLVMKRFLDKAPMLIK